MSKHVGEKFGKLWLMDGDPDGQTSPYHKLICPVWRWVYRNDPYWFWGQRSWFDVKFEFCCRWGICPFRTALVFIVTKETLQDKIIMCIWFNSQDRKIAEERKKLEEERKKLEEEREKLLKARQKLKEVCWILFRANETIIRVPPFKVWEPCSDNTVCPVHFLCNTIHLASSF